MPKFSTFSRPKIKVKSTLTYGNIRGTDAIRVPGKGSVGRIHTREASVARGKYQSPGHKAYLERLKDL